jgi:bacteriocin-like protein
MRNLTANELQAVTGGAMAIAVRKEPPIVGIIVRVLEDVIARLEGGRPMRPTAPTAPQRALA